MPSHKKINKRERGVISRLLAQGQKVREIARYLCRSPSTISDEILRNRIWNGEEFIYDAIMAQEEYERRKSEAGTREPNEILPDAEHRGISFVAFIWLKRKYKMHNASHRAV